jgi:hypothetical protein
MRDKKKRNCYVHAAILVTELMQGPKTVRQLMDALELTPNAVKGAMRPFRAAGMIRVAGVAPDIRGHMKAILYEWGTAPDVELPPSFKPMVYACQSDDLLLAAFRRKVRAAAAPRKPIVQDLARS